LKKLSWIDADKLTAFILSAQDSENGGIADRPGDMADVFHTQFGVAGMYPPLPPPVMHFVEDPRCQAYLC